MTSLLSKFIEHGCIWSADGTPASEKLLGYSSYAPPPQNKLHTKYVPFEVPEVDNDLPERGIPAETVHEWFYKEPDNFSTSIIPCAISVLFPRNLIKQHLSNKDTRWNKKSRFSYPFLFAWIGKKIWPTPFFLEQALSFDTGTEDALSVNFLNHCLFIDPPNEQLTLWSIETALRSPAFAFVAADCPHLSLTASRRFSLAARAGKTLGFLMRGLKDLDSPSAACGRWLLETVPSKFEFPSYHIHLKSSKGFAPRKRSWVIEHELFPCFQTSQEISMHISPDVGGGHCEKRVPDRKFGT